MCEKWRGREEEGRERGERESSHKIVGQLKTVNASAVKNMIAKLTNCSVN
jgi:hypothetical protein